MRFVKIFKDVENNLWSLEEEVNKWIEETGAKVISITGNIAPQTDDPHGQVFSASDILLVVLYERST